MSTVAVLGASDNPERIAYLAMQRLLNHNYDAVPVSPRGGEILGRTVLPNLAAMAQAPDTVTLYVGTDRQAGLIDEIIAAQPRRVIFNPGTENPAAYDRLRAAGIEVQEACTLVLLSTRQFDLPA